MNSQKKINNIKLQHKKQYEIIINKQQTSEKDKEQEERLRNLEKKLREQEEINQQNEKRIKQLEKELKKSQITKLTFAKNEQSNNSTVLDITSNNNENLPEVDKEFEKSDNQSINSLKLCIKTNCEKILKINSTDPNIKKIKKIKKQIDNISGNKIKKLASLADFWHERTEGSHEAWTNGEVSLTIATHPKVDHDERLVKKIFNSVIDKLEKELKKIK